MLCLGQPGGHLLGKSSPLLASARVLFDVMPSIVTDYDFCPEFVLCEIWNSILSLCLFYLLVMDFVSILMCYNRYNC